MNVDAFRGIMYSNEKKGINCWTLPANYDEYLTAELSLYKTHPEILAYDASKNLTY